VPPSPNGLEVLKPEAEADLEVISILIGGALVRLPTRTYVTFLYSHAQSVLIALNLQLLWTHQPCSPSLSWCVRDGSKNVVPAPPVATGGPEADPKAILSTEDFVDSKDIKQHLADPDLEVFGKTPDEDHRNMRRSQTPATSSVAPEATTTVAHDEL